MPHEILNGKQISTIFIKMGAKSMAEGITEVPIGKPVLRQDIQGILGKNRLTVRTVFGMAI